MNYTAFNFLVKDYGTASDSVDIRLFVYVPDEGIQVRIDAEGEGKKKELTASELAKVQEFMRTFNALMSGVARVEPVVWKKRIESRFIVWGEKDEELLPKPIREKDLCLPYINPDGNSDESEKIKFVETFKERLDYLRSQCGMLQPKMDSVAESSAAKRPCRSRNLLNEGSSSSESSSEDEHESQLDTESDAECDTVSDSDSDVTELKGNINDDF
jgi:hypothetical protein